MRELPTDPDDEPDDAFESPTLKNVAGNLGVCFVTRGADDVDDDVSLEEVDGDPPLKKSRENLGFFRRIGDV